MTLDGKFETVVQSFREVDLFIRCIEKTLYFVDFHDIIITDRETFKISTIASLFS